MDSLVLMLIQTGFLFVYVVNGDPQGWVHYNNHYYYYSDANDKPLQADARSKCVALGADLWSIADNKEQASINLNISTGYSIGLRPDEGKDTTQRKNWYWLDGTKYDVNKFHNWGDDYPQYVATSKCGRLFQNGTWRNNNCTGTPYQYICKKQDPCVPGASICNNGNCSVVHNETQYYCDCWAGYTGQQCETNINECDSSPCVNGNCIDNINGYWCDCSGTGFDWEHCDKDINECEENILVCENSGSCVNTDGGAHCDCVPGTTGVQCEIDINECYSNPCDKGDCIDQLNGYICVCFEGYTGTHCETDINECGTGELNCVNNGTCVNTPGSAHCDCVNGATGEQCETNIDDCVNSQCVNGNCVDQFGGYFCNCDKGYTGIYCETNINECSEQLHECVSGTCHNFDSSYKCNCTDGFVGAFCEFGNDTVPVSYNNDNEALTIAFYTSLGICIAINSGFLSMVIYYYLTDWKMKKSANAMQFSNLQSAKRTDEEDPIVAGNEAACSTSSQGERNEI